MFVYLNLKPYLMASSSSSSSPSPCTLSYHAFTSFHGPDVGKTFISHLHKQFTSNRITMFDDEGIERGHTIDPALTQVIRESTISIVVLTKNYASSSWCLDGLLEILKCRQAGKLIVMPVFYGVRPNDVQRQTGDFGKGFEKTCRGKTIKEKGRWSQALNKVCSLKGFIFSPRFVLFCFFFFSINHFLNRIWKICDNPVPAHSESGSQPLQSTNPNPSHVIFH